MPKYPPRSQGVTIFAILILVSSCIHIQKLIDDVPIYVKYYSYLPPWLMLLRYSFSWFQRMVGILIGVGLLGQKDIARKAGIALGIFTSVTVPWKHPYEAFKLHTQFLDQHYGFMLSGTSITFSSLTRVSDIIHCFLDVLFWAIYIYFFTRPSVKAQFKPSDDKGN